MERKTESERERQRKKEKDGRKKIGRRRERNREKTKEIKRDTRERLAAQKEEWKNTNKKLKQKCHWTKTNFDTLMALSNKMLVNFVSIFCPSSMKLRKLAADGNGSLEVALALVAGGAGAEKSALGMEEGKEEKESPGIPAVAKLGSCWFMLDVDMEAALAWTILVWGEDWLVATVAELSLNGDIEVFSNVEGETAAVALRMGWRGGWGCGGGGSRWDAMFISW